METLLYFADETDFTQALLQFKNINVSLNIVNSCIIESSLNLNEIVQLNLKGATVINLDTDDLFIEQLPLVAKLAVMAYIKRYRTRQNANTTEGLLWNTSGFQSPGRPGPKD
jgi:hypothetical protein